ncbi:tetratricopeptide repeat protein [bacterium]|nr:tetratricopeptide repeat protein [bacterium]
MKVYAGNTVRTFALVGMLMTQALCSVAFAQSGRPKVLVLPPKSTLDKKVVTSFQWELAKQLDKSGKFDIISQEQFDSYIKGMKGSLEETIASDTLLAMMMDSLKASIYTSGTLDQTGGAGSQVRAKIDYVFLSHQSEGKNYTIEGQPATVDNEKQINDLADKCVEVIITASERISARSIAMSYFRSAIYDKAIENFKKLQELQPGDADASFMIATCYLNMDSTEKALGLYQQILDTVDPNYVPALEILAKTYFTNNDFVKAETYYGKLIQAKPDDYGYHQYMAYVKLRLEKAAEAIDEFDKTVAIRDDSPEIRFQMGYAEFNLAKGLEKTDPAAYKARLEHDLQSLDRAVEMLRQKQDLDDTQKKMLADCLFYKGSTLQALERGQGALDAFSSIFEVQPDYQNAFYSYYNMARIANDLKKYEEAIKYYREAIKLAPEASVWSFYLNIGEIYRMRFKDSRNAVEAYTSALKGAPADNQQALFYLRGINYYDLGQELDYSSKEDADIDALIEKGDMTKDKAIQAVGYYDKAAADLARVSDAKYAKSAKQHLDNIAQLKTRAEQIKKQIDYNEKTK